MPAISQRTLVQNSFGDQIHSGVLNRDLLGNATSSRKNSHMTGNNVSNLNSIGRGI